ncbi:MAG: hypothetical protein QOI76_3561 [Frankiales bacterium]|nr:hypothetical protein [Frankiales bacterium]
MSARARTPAGRSGSLLAAATTAVVLVPLAIAALAPQAVAAAPAPPAGFTTVWSDGFTGAAGTPLSGSNWLYDLGHSYPGGAGNWGTGEVEEATSSTTNVYQDGNGHLVIKPVRDSAGNWTSGRVETQRTDFAAPAGGQLEITASLQQPNPASALGYWPAFWIMGAAARPVGATNWPSIGEMDVMEDVNGLSQVSHTFHCGVWGGGPCNETTGISSGLLACAGCQTGFHTYSVVIDRRNTSAEQLRFSTDGVLQHTVNESQVPLATWTAAVDHGFFPILDVAIGGSYPDNVCHCITEGAADLAGTSSGAAMTVDYVAVYVQGGSGSPAPTPTASPTLTASPTPTVSASPTTPSPGPTTTSSAAPSTSPAPAGGIRAGSTIQAESASAAFGTSTQATTDTGGGLDVTGIGNGDWLKYSKVDFGSTPVTSLLTRVAAGAANGVSGLVEVHLDILASPSIGGLAVGNTGGWQSWRSVPGNIGAVTGVHDVYLTFTSGQPADYLNLNWLSFPGGPTGSASVPPATSAAPTTAPSSGSPPGGISATSTIQAESANVASGTRTESTTDSGGGSDVTGIGNNDLLRLDNVDFGTTPLSQLNVRVASGAAGGISGLIEVHLDSASSPAIGTLAVGSTGGWQSWITTPANISRTTGRHTVFLRFGSGQPADFVNLNWLSFSP